MNLLKIVWNWLVYSSKDPENFSLTLKAGIPLLFFLGAGSQVALNGSVEPVVSFLVLTGQWVTGAVTVYGALRKVYLTFFLAK